MVSDVLMKTLRVFHLVVLYKRIHVHVTKLSEYYVTNVECMHVFVIRFTFLLKR
jgi:hypothetical protein